MRATMKTIYANEWEMGEDPCIVRLTGNNIEVAYDVDNEAVVWTGAEKGDGHFELRCDAKRGRATLHKFAHEPNKLVGIWSEVDDGYYLEGAWILELEED